MESMPVELNVTKTERMVVDFGEALITSNFFFIDWTIYFVYRQC